MKRVTMGIAIVGVLALTALSASAAAGLNLRAHPYEYNPGNAAVDITAEWRPGAGLADLNGKANQGLVLGMADDIAFPPGGSAAAEITNVEGLVLTSLSFDHKLGTDCSGGVPRFTIETEAGSGYFQCSGGTHAPIVGSPGWEHITFTCADWTGASPCPQAGSPLTFMELQQDIKGESINDNLEVNGCVMGKPGNC